MPRSLHWTLAALGPLVVAAGGLALLLTSGGDRQIALLAFLPGIALCEYFFGLASGLATVFLSVAGSAWFRIVVVPSSPERHLPERFAWENEVILLGAGLLIVFFIELLRRSRAREHGGAVQLRQLLANMADAAFVFNSDLRLVDANAAAFRLAGRTPHELMGRTAAQLRAMVRTTPEFEAGTPNIERALRGESFSGLRATIHDPRDGRQIEIICSVAPLPGAKGKIVGVLLLLSDVTQLRALERHAADLERHEVVGRVAAGLTHDFNNVLEVVRKALGVLDMIEDHSNAERRHYRDMIHNAVLRGGETIRRLRQHLAGGPGEMRPLDLNQVVRQAVELTAPLWKSRDGLHVKLELGELPAIWGSRVDLSRALTNLLFNAFEAIGDRPGQVTAHTERDGQRVRGWIEDTGPGVPASELSRIFLPYQTSKDTGTGLGLFTTQRIILGHGGHISVSSPPGRGARFEFDFPAIADRDGALPRAPSQEAAPRPARG